MTGDPTLPGQVIVNPSFGDEAPTLTDTNATQTEFKRNNKLRVKSVKLNYDKLVKSNVVSHGKKACVLLVRRRLSM